MLGLQPVSSTVTRDESEAVDEWVEEHQENIQLASELEQKNLKASAVSRKKTHDRRIPKKPQSGSEQEF
jgi:hypothetical protein